MFPNLPGENMKIMITGGSGLIGQYLNIELSKKHDIITLFNKHEGNCKEFNFSKADITDHRRVSEIFKSFGPKLVVHTAGVSSPAMADKLLPERVEDINVNATRHLAELCNQYKTKMIYLSTDLIYGSDTGSFHKEDADVEPISLYAKSKLEGEKVIRKTYFNYLILRQAIVYGYGLNDSTNFFDESIEKLKEGKPVNLFTDQHRTPVEIEDTARIIAELCESDVKGEIINLGGKERLNRYELFEIAAEEFGLNKDLLKKTTMDDEELKYKASDVSMNTDKLRDLGITPKDTRQAMKELKDKFMN